MNQWTILKPTIKINKLRQNHFQILKDQLQHNRPHCRPQQYQTKTHKTHPTKKTKLTPTTENFVENIDTHLLPNKSFFDNNKKLRNYQSITHNSEI